MLTAGSSPVSKIICMLENIRERKFSFRQHEEMRRRSDIRPLPVEFFFFFFNTKRSSANLILLGRQRTPLNSHLYSKSMTKCNQGRQRWVRCVRNCRLYLELVNSIHKLHTKKKNSIFTLGKMIDLRLLQPRYLIRFSELPIQMTCVQVTPLRYFLWFSTFILNRNVRDWGFSMESRPPPSTS